MKKSLLLMVFAIVASHFANAQNVNIPDANFKAYLIGNSAINTNSDTAIQVSEATAYAGNLNCNGQSISDLTGIEAFVNITELYCYNNHLTTLDLSQNTALTELRCADNDITSLNLSQNTALTYLSCSNNNLNTLDITQNTSLTFLGCGNNNLSSLDVSQNTLLNYLNYGGNNLSTIDISQNVLLKRIYAYNNNLTSLDLSQNTALLELRCANNNISNLNTSQNTALTLLSCADNNLTALNLSQNTALKTLSCPSNNLTSLDINQNTALEIVYCQDNEITQLDVNQNTALEILYCQRNQLTQLDASQNIAIERLYCYENQLTQLDVSQNTALRVLFASKNQLSCLNVANGNNPNMVIGVKDNPNLFCIQIDSNYTPASSWQKEAYANWNTDCQRPILYVSQDSIDFGLVTLGSTVSQDFIIRNEGCLDLTLDNITYTGSTEFTQNMPNAPITLTSGESFILTVEYTPTSIGTPLLGTINFTHNNGSQSITIQGEGTNDCLIYIPDANFKSYLLGNSAINTNGNTQIECSEAQAFDGGINCSSLSINNIVGIEAFVNITDLICENNSINSLDLSQNTALTYLNCAENYTIDSLDLSQNTMLNYLNCSHNNLKVLNISHLDSLSQLYCFYNQIDSLNVRNNLALNVLNCGNNSLNTLDVTQNTALTLLYARNNNLNSLDVTQNTQLERLECHFNQLTALDVSNNTVLKHLNCSYNYAYFIDLDVSNNPLLELLHCNNNDITSLDLSNNTALKDLNCSSNSINNLDLSNNTALRNFRCEYNNISSLDLSNNLDLRRLICNNNHALPSLDLSANTALTELRCHSNKLHSLNVANGNNTNMYRMWARYNPNLTCIQHDAGFDPSTNSNWTKNIGTSTIWSDNCGCLTTSATDIHTACDNFTWIDGNTYTESNYNAVDTLINAEGCDSIVTLNVTINEIIMNVDSQTACNSYTWIDGNTYTTNNNTATHTLTSIVGCDSIVTLNLSMETPPTLSITQNGLDLKATSGMDSYQWFFDGTAISGATTANYTATENGNYHCEAVQGICSSISGTINITGVSINEVAFQGLKIYPNPTKGILYIEVNETLTEINLYDVTGKLVKTFAPNSRILNVSKVNKGIYYLSFKNNKHHSVQKITLQ